MYTKVKTAKEIEAMRESGRMLAAVLKLLQAEVEPGITTQSLADMAHRELKKLGGEPAFLGYDGFPSVLCVSINDEVVHGIPGDRVVVSGDLVSLDFGVRYEGMITDAAVTVVAGQTNKEKERLINGTKESLQAAIKAIRGSTHVGDISTAVQAVLGRNKFGIVRDLVGHGVGHTVHEDPNIPNYGKKGEGPLLQVGMTIAIEPMATLGDWKVVMDPDHWTIRTADGSLSAHFEHTVLVTEKAAEVLTAL